MRACWAVPGIGASSQRTSTDQRRAELRSRIACFPDATEPCQSAPSRRGLIGACDANPAGGDNLRVGSDSEFPCGPVVPLRGGRRRRQLSGARMCRRESSDAHDQVRGAAGCHADGSDSRFWQACVTRAGQCPQVQPHDTRRKLARRCMRPGTDREAGGIGTTRAASYLRRSQPDRREGAARLQRLLREGHNRHYAK